MRDRVPRVLFLVPALITGGMERQLVLLAKGLDRHQFEPVVWCPGAWGYFGDMLLENNVQVLRKPFDLSGPQAVDDLIAWLKALEVSIFYSFAGVNEFDTVLAKAAGIPVCITCRGDMRYWDACGAVTLLEQLRNSETDAIVPHCEAIGQLCSETECLPPGKVHVIRSAIEIPLNPANIRENPPLIGFVANYRPVKGHEVLLCAMRDVVNVIPSAQLMLAGRMRPEIVSHAAKLGISHCVTFPGEVADVESLYRQLTLYVQPSFSEGLSNALLEAMAYGVPVIATRVGGTAEAVIEGLTGLLVEPNDPIAVANVMIRLLRDERKREEMGKAARDWMIRNFSVERLVSRHERLFTDLLQSTTARRSGTPTQTLEPVDGY